MFTQEQIVVIVTALIVQAIKIIWVKLLGQPKPSVGRIRQLVFIVAIPLAYFVGDFGVPSLGEDPMGFAVALIAAAGEVLVFAHVLYEAILKGVLSWLDRGSELLTP